MQIGPKIRVGGTVGHVGQAIKTGVGKVAQPVGKAVSLINPALGTAISTAGDVLDTTDGAFDFGKAAKNAALQYGVGKVANTVGKQVLGASGIGSKVKVLAGAAGKKLLTGGDGASGGGIDRNGILDKLLLGAGVASSAADKMRQQKMQDQASKYATGSYDARAGLREKGIADMLHQSTPDLSGVFAAPGNPYAVQARKPIAPAPAIAPPTMIGTRTPVRLY